MRKIVITLLILLALTVSPVNSYALAQTSGYGRVLKEGIMLYKNPEMTAQDMLFELTMSYYVYILDLNTLADYYEVEYHSTENGYVKLIGYIKKTDVTLSDTASAPYYPQILAKFIKSAYVYQSFSVNTQILLNGISGQTVRCYGKIYNETEEKYFYYAKIGSDFGYIPADSLEVTEPALHPDPLPTPPPTPTPSNAATPKPSNGNNSGGNIEGDDDNTMQIILIAAISVPALIIVYLMFRPAKKSRRGYHKYYGEENDEE